MPVFGYLILLNARLDEWLQVHAPWIPESTNLDTGWRIIFLFYGTMLLGGGSALFSFYCPLKVKKYDSPVEFAESETSFFSPSEHKKNLVELLGLASKDLSHWQKKIPELRILRDVHVALNLVPQGDWYLRYPNQRKLLVEHFDNLTVIMTQYWYLLDTERYVLRVFTFALFVAGSILLAIPSAITFAQVTIATLRYWLQ